MTAMTLDLLTVGPWRATDGRVDLPQRRPCEGALAMRSSMHRELSVDALRARTAPGSLRPRRWPGAAGSLRPAGDPDAVVVAGLERRAVEPPVHAHELQPHLLERLLPHLRVRHVEPHGGRAARGVSRRISGT